jgi:uncharacterized membrane protein
VWLQGLRVDALARRVNELELQLFALREGAPAPAPQAPVETPGRATTAEEPLLLTEVAPDDVLVLDTPLPETSNDVDGAVPPSPPAKQQPSAPLLLDRPEAVATQAQPEPRKARPRFDQWLAESGLAWIGGGALALGAIFLVSFATQQNWFTPQVRLWGAVLLGLIGLGVSEWTRRANAKAPPGHPLVPALSAGAGVVAFYAAAWAAHGVYGFIDLPLAASLLTACAILLIALSLMHGEALGVLAIGAALLS